MHEPIVIIDYVGQIANGQFIATDGVPSVGLTFVYGMIWSSQEVTIDFQQGINDTTGSFIFRHSVLDNVPANTAIAREYPVSGKYCRVVITNSSGTPADVEVFFCARYQE